MKKILIFIILIAITLMHLNSAVYDSYKDLNVLETEHFDIVFDNTSIDEGFMIYNNCEKIYKDINLFFDLDRSQHLNVVITSDYQRINAYFSIMPSPHIVLYNTTGVNNDLNIFTKDYLLNIFTHELTHALTLMSENNFVRQIFSQSLTFSLLNVTSFTAEGLAVLSESLEDGGRLNSPQYKSRMLSARLENKFLKYNDVQGNRNIYPYDLFYIYGAFFNLYLFDTYGIEKYREYVAQFHKFQLLFFDPNFAFKKVYDKSIYEVWDDFELSFDLIETNNIDYKKLDYVPSMLSKSSDSVLVYQKSNDSIKDIKTGETVLKYISNTYHFSVNDNKLVLSCYKQDPLYKTSLIIHYDNAKTTLNIDNFKMGIAYKNYIVGIYNQGQKQSIGFSKNDEIVKQIDLGKDEYVQKIDIINEKLVYLSKFNSKDVITILLDDNTKQIFSPEENMEIIDFSIDNNKIYLSIVQDNQLPRLSYLDTNENRLYTNEFDIIGGLYNPIVMDNEVYYIAKLFEENELRFSSLDSFNFVAKPISVKTVKIVDSTKIDYDLNKMGKYNIFKYMLNGTFLPIIYPDGVGASTTIFYNSVDPAEFINMQIFSKVNLYEDFNVNLTLNIYSLTGNKYSGVTLIVDTKLKDITNNTTYNFEQSFVRKFDLSNNTFLTIATTNITDFTTSITTFNEVGYGCRRRIGPTNQNIFGAYISYQPTVNWNIYNNVVFLTNRVTASIRLPYLIPFIKYDRATLNLPIKISYDYDIESLSHSYAVSLLLFDINMQRAFKKLPFYFHNIQSYIDYNSADNIISANTILSSSVTQTTLSNMIFNPGFKCSYNFDTNDFLFEVNLYANF